MKDKPIFIVGGGIAGLAAAKSLAPHGHPIQVFERSAEFARSGAGLQVGPNAVRALKAIGAWDAFQPFVYRPPEIHIRDGTSGRIIKRVRLGTDFERRFGSPYGVAHRADLHACLLHVATAHGTVEVVRKSDVARVTVIDDGVEINDLRGTCVIAADGIDSRLRAAALDDGDAQQLPYTLQRMSASTSKALGDIAMDCVNLWLCPRSHVVHYPIAGNVLNIVVASDGLDSGLSKPIAPALSELLNAATSTGFWPVKRVPRLRRWHNGLMCLVGDAAHGTAPFLAQGAAMALEDAARLGQEFDLKNIRSSFESFETQRRARCQRLDSQSCRMGRIYHQRDLLAEARNLGIRLGLAAWTTDWIYRGS